MKITVTLECRHPDGYSNHSDQTGSRAYIDSSGAVLDGLRVVERDRRPVRLREPGHPWLGYDGEAWTGFTVRVEP